jgi:hypothetical protein
MTDRNRASHEMFESLHYILSEGERLSGEEHAADQVIELCAKALQADALARIADSLEAVIDGRQDETVYVRHQKMQDYS